MSTKNLARTVIEGGRTGHSKYLRRHSLRTRRVRERAVAHAVRGNPDIADGVLWPEREQDWDDVEHADRTNPCERFLASRAGRPWNDVKSEIFRRFDRRSVPGRHVVFSHLIDRVIVPGEYRYFLGFRLEHCRFWVDAWGVLRHNPDEKY